MTDHFQISTISNKVYDKNQDAYLQMVETIDVKIELVSSNIVEKFIKKNNLLLRMLRSKHYRRIVKKF